MSLTQAWVITYKDQPLTYSQLYALNNEFGSSGWSRLDIPHEGLPIGGLNEVVRDAKPHNIGLVVATPIPTLVKLAHKAGLNVCTLHQEQQGSWVLV